MRRCVAWRTAPFTVMIVVLTAFVLPLFAAAQLQGHVPRIAVLDLNFPPATAEPRPIFEAFRHELRERGWVEGHTIAIEWRWAEGNLERFATLVDEVIRLQVEVIVVPHATAAVITHKATKTIPIVVMGGGLIMSGLIASPARPGGNVTGRSTFPQDITAKQLELLKQAVPEVTQVAVLGGPSRYSDTLPMLEDLARSLGVELHLFDVRDPTEFARAFAAMTGAQAQALLVLGDDFFFPYRQQIAERAVQQHLPSVCTGRAYVEAGCRMGYNTNTKEAGQQIAAYVDKILRGAKPADLPVEQPTRFAFVVNLKTAQALGLTLPHMVLFQADEAIR